MVLAKYGSRGRLDGCGRVVVGGGAGDALRCISGVSSD
jgi:hypothetical protein